MNGSPIGKRLPDEEKYCLTCGKRLARRMDEDRSNFRNRRHCNLSCGSMKQTVGKQGLLWRSRKFVRKKCEACGTNRQLHVHHCDGNRMNNDLKNLQTLCV